MKINKNIRDFVLSLATGFVCVILLFTFFRYLFLILGLSIVYMIGKNIYFKYIVNKIDRKDLM